MIEQIFAVLQVIGATVFLIACVIVVLVGAVCICVLFGLAYGGMREARTVRRERAERVERARTLNGGGITDPVETSPTPPIRDGYRVNRLPRAR